MKPFSTRSKLILSEAASFAVGAVAVAYYWTHQSYQSIGIVLTVDFFLSGVNTVLWLRKTDGR